MQTAKLQPFHPIPSAPLTLMPMPGLIAGMEVCSMLPGRWVSQLFLQTCTCTSFMCTCTWHRPAGQHPTLTTCTSEHSRGSRAPHSPAVPRPVPWLAHAVGLPVQLLLLLCFLMRLPQPLQSGNLTQPPCTVFLRGRGRDQTPASVLRAPTFWRCASNKPSARQPAFS